MGEARLGSARWVALAGPRDGRPRRVPAMKNRVEVMHGVNLDQLGQRDPAHYGSITLTELEFRIKQFARDFGLEMTFSQTNHEGEFCENLHRAPEMADALVLNPGA